MTLRRQVADLIALGAMPASEDTSVSTVAEFQQKITALQTPLTTEEARALLPVFGTDDYFGLAWTLLHRVETAPDPVVAEEPYANANWWVRLLWDRYQRWLASRD
jgi:hypothetical protein